MKKSVNILTMMKRNVRILVVAMLAMSMMVLAGCKRDPVEPEPTPQPVEEPTYETLEGTEWEGAYATHDQYPDYTSTPLTIHWTVDFLNDGRGEVMFWFESENYDPDPYSWEFTYTFEDNQGVISDDSGDKPFICDPYNRTMSLNLTVSLQNEEDGPVYTYGGPVTLHQTRR